MQGIVKYVHHKTGNPVKFMISTDIEKDREEFEKRKQGAGEDHRTRYRTQIDFEIVEVSDNPSEIFADYVLPKSDRLNYDKSVRDAVTNGMKLKKICNAVDWVVEHFPDREFSFEILVDNTEEKPRIIAEVLKREKRFEKYEFHGGKEPVVRTYY